jgi:DNA adenine methylase
MPGKSARPFVKWAGGKSQLLEQFEEYYPKKLTDGKMRKYIEPFVGGGAVFFHLQSKYKFNEVILNDINEEVILTYRIVQTNVVELIQFLAELENDYMGIDLEGKEKLYYEQREKFNEEKGTIDYDVYSTDWICHAGRMIFLNKTCFNGLYRQNRKGLFNVPFGKRANPSICDRENLLEVNKALKGVTLISGDFQDLTKYVDSDTFIYIDPPYKPLNDTSSFNDYSKEPFDDNSQIRLANWTKELDSKGAHFMLSNSDPTNVNPDNLFFEDLYKDFTINKVLAFRAINSKGSGRGQLREILVVNEPAS